MSQHRRIRHNACILRPQCHLAMKEEVPTGNSQWLEPQRPSSHVTITGIISRASGGAAVTNILSWLASRTSRRCGALCFALLPSVPCPPPFVGTQEFRPQSLSRINHLPRLTTAFAYEARLSRTCQPKSFYGILKHVEDPSWNRHGRNQAHQHWHG